MPPDWLRRQLDYANAGWDVVLGTVTVTDWDGHPPHVPVAFADATPSAPGRTLMYTEPISASGLPPTWPQAGSRRCGRPKTTHCSPPRPAGCMVAQASDIAVETSGRRLARAPRGFGDLLRTLAG